MESSSKIWLRRFLVIVPVLCILVSVALCERTRDEADDIETVKRELKAYFEAESKKLRDEVERLVKRKLEIQNQIDADKEKIKQQLTEVMDMVASVRREKRHAVGSSGGAVYVHWGREACSSTAQPVYTGIAGGGLSSHPGAAVNMLCMTRNPVWGQHGNNANYFTYLYGVEYKVASNDFPFGHQRAQAIHNHNVPCTVCQSYNRSNTIMIPGTTVCEAGWTTEYSGYLMAGRSDHAAATKYNCIDANPDTDSGSASQGIAGGGLSTHSGAAVNMLCMTHTPGWGKHGNNANYFTYLYGAEYKVASNDFPLGHQRAQAIHNHDVPCTVCQSYNRSNTIMIPGTTVCEAGWTTEYSGYLMAGRSDHAAATEYNCIDANPDTHESGSSIEGGRLLYRVKAKCGALPCSPYVEMRELTCVVCTK